MGRVYRVEDTKAKEEIALKLIKPEIADDKKTIERFRNELTTARKIAHRNVCRMPSSNKPSIAVLYFENTNDDENLKGYRTMLSNMMITDLSQSKYLNILTIDKTYSLLKKLGIEESKRYSTEDLIKVSREGQVDYVVTGSYIQGIEDFTITFVMQKL